MTAGLLYIFIYLFAAVLAVFLCKKMGLGAVLGYLLAGVIIGPVFGLVGGETQEIQHIAEFGVVIMLFLVGLELAPNKLWQLRHQLLGLGGLQVLLTIGAISLLAYWLGLAWQTGVALGCVFAMSSTAIVLQTLDEKGLNNSTGGRASFATLLTQDIAVIPILALLPLLSLSETGQSQVVTQADSFNLLMGLDNYHKALVSLAVMALVIVGGHFLFRPLFRYIAATKLREMFTLLALTIVIGVSLLMSLIGLSSALGTFIAGVMLANSEYRHELENTLEPFKGLLLGLFFITVGAGINFSLLGQHFFLITALVIGVMALKFGILWLIATIFKLNKLNRYLYALSLAQAGEFGFVLLSFDVANHLLSQQLADQMLLVVTLSMLLTPLLFIFYDKVIVVKSLAQQSQTEPETPVIEEQNPIILIGNGRFGQVIGKLLRSCGYQLTIIDYDSAIVEGFSRYGVKTYYGDGSRADLLVTAGVAQAKLLIIAIDHPDQTKQILQIAEKLNPQLPIVIRAYDQRDLYNLYLAGGEHIVRETFHSALEAGKQALQLLGVETEKAEQIRQTYQQLEQQAVQQMKRLYDPNEERFSNKALLQLSKEIDALTAVKLQQILHSSNVQQPNVPQQDSQ